MTRNPSHWSIRSGRRRYSNDVDMSNQGNETGEEYTRQVQGKGGGKRPGAPTQASRNVAQRDTLKTGFIQSLPDYIDHIVNVLYERFNVAFCREPSGRADGFFVSGFCLLGRPLDNLDQMEMTATKGGHGQFPLDTTLYFDFSSCEHGLKLPRASFDLTIYFPAISRDIAPYDIAFAGGVRIAIVAKMTPQTGQGGGGDETCNPQELIGLHGRISGTLLWHRDCTGYERGQDSAGVKEERPDEQRGPRQSRDCEHRSWAVAWAMSRKKRGRSAGDLAVTPKKDVALHDDTAICNKKTDLAAHGGRTD
ncbi:hypothetical protein P389DRAFT_189032 [Cystobasidium minutum MCA 4210]|uniref:uncharacterized protein n=1 Tax=Cystobasidium minutum MCA 4210 TaxID=1397322 RepID=UPI0034CFDA02|eukprot:jgi/Rhomi1/189032/estExt_fgenesh1_pg.C_3_t10466